MNANGVKLRSEGTWEEMRGGKRGVLGLKLEESASNPSATTHPAQTGMSLSPLRSRGDDHFSFTNRDSFGDLPP
jgi:hypothetical protein